MRDGPRDPPRNAPGDGPRDLRDPNYTREDNRYQMQGRPPVMSGSYRNILNETGSQDTGHDQVNDRFAKRGRDDRDFRPSDRDEKRPRPEDHGPRDMNRQMPDSYANKSPPRELHRNQELGQQPYPRRDGPIGRNGGPPPRGKIGGPDLTDDQRRDFYGREPRPLDGSIDRGEGGPPRFGGRGPGPNPRDDAGRGRGQGRGGRGPFRGRGPGRGDFGRGDGDYGRNLPPSSRDRDGREMNAVPPYHRNEGSGWNRRPEDEGNHPNSAPVKRDQREREALPSFSSYSQLALNEIKPAKPRTPAAATSTPGKSPGKSEQAKPRAPVTDAMEAKSVKKEEVKETKPPPGPKPPPLPPKGKPTGAMLALARLLELEASMEYAYTKHMLLMKRQKELAEQYKVLETLPVGIDAIKDDLEAAILQSTPQDA